MSMGGPTAHPALMKAEANPATPDNISQKHIVVNKRIEVIEDVQDAGQDGRSLEHLNALKDKRRVASTRHFFLRIRLGGSDDQFGTSVITLRMFSTNAVRQRQFKGTPVN